LSKESAGSNLAPQGSGTTVATYLSMIRLRENDMPWSSVGNTPLTEESAASGPAVDPGASDAAHAPSRQRMRDPLEARLRDMRNPHRRRWQPES